MESNYILPDIDFYHFTYYIATAFIEYLESVNINPYKQLDEDWWHSIATEFVPIIDSNNISDEEENIHTTLYNKVMAELDNALTKEQKDALTFKRDAILEKIRLSILGFINRNIRICYCGDEDCDWSCGVQICGCCIDSIKCDYYDCDYSD